MLVLAGHLLFYIFLQPPEQKRSQQTMQPLDQAAVLVEFGMLNGPVQGVTEPVLKIKVGRENMRHQEMK